MTTTSPDKRRRKATVRKNIRLTPEVIAEVTEWCKTNGTSFSAGAETLLLMSLGKPASEYIVPAIVSATRRATLACTSSTGCPSCGPSPPSNPVSRRGWRA